MKLNLSNIDEIAELIKTGKTPPSKNKKYFDGKIAWYTPGDLGKSFYLQESERTITEEAIRDNKAVVFPKGTVLISCIGDIGKVGVCFSGRSSSNQQITGILPTKDVASEYLYYWVKANKKILEHNSNNAVVPILNNAALKRIKLKCPSFEEQKQIVQNLDTADTLRQNRKEQLNLLDDYLKSVFFKMFGDPIHNEKKWSCCEVYKLCSKIIDCPHSTPKYADVITDYPCIRSSDLQDGFVDYATTKYVEFSVYQDRTQRCVPEEGDVIYCREGARYGSSGYLSSGTKACLGQRTMMFRAMPDKVTPEFLWGLISSDSIYFQARQMAGGAASPHINVKDIKKFKVFCPPIELQKKFSNIFKLIQTTKQKMHASLDEMDNHFNALMQRYFG